ncbi:MAG: hypothetical protein AAGI01_13085, partial [Myxococcota bacterium]
AGVEEQDGEHEVAMSAAAVEHAALLAEGERAEEGSPPEVVHGVDKNLGGRPFLGTFTFGEQGRMLDGGSRHGNLMLTVLLFYAREPAA